MRGSIVLAAGLLVTNIALLQSADTPTTTPIEKQPIIIIESIIETAPVARVAADTPETKRLRWFWQAKHNGLRVPACDHFDPLAVLDADVDPTPGHEHVIGNRQFGVMMFDAQGTFLAHMDPLGCAEASTEDQSLSLTFDNRLIVRTRNMLSDGEHLKAFIVERRIDELHLLLELDVGGKRKDAERESQVESRIVMGYHDLEVIHHGRRRTNGGPWVAVDNHCTWQLATLTFSCRTRGEGQTPESE